MSPKDGLEVYYRNKTPFLQLEIRRDHMSLDLWLIGDQLEEARASGIARAHPFLGDEAVKVRFERAEDLARVNRWIEASYEYAPNRSKKSTKKVKAVDSQKPIATPPPSGPSTPATISSPPSPAAATKSEAKNGAAAKKNGAAAKKASAKKATEKKKTARPARPARLVKAVKAKPKKAAAKAKPKKAAGAKSKRSSARR